MNYDNRLRRSEWVVAGVDLETATRMVTEYHYAHGGSNTKTYLHGLFLANDIYFENCFGVAWWIPPTKTAARATYPENWQGVLCLSRLVILPAVPKNAATFLLASSRKKIDRRRWPCLVTYADEWRGHKGTIYLADNWQFVGKTKPEAVWVRGDRMVARKHGPHTRTKAEMIAMGCEMVGRFPKNKFMRVDL